jgi:hypothetical protein
MSTFWLPGHPVKDSANCEMGDMTVETAITECWPSFLI